MSSQNTMKVKAVRIDLLLVNFIDSIRQHPELWDKKHAGYYKNRKGKAQIWEKLAKQHNFPDSTAAHDKWVSVRNRCNQLRKAGTATFWPYMQAMAFYQGRINNSTKKRNLRRSKIAIDGDPIKIDPMAEEEANCNNGPQMPPNLAIVKKEPQNGQDVADQQNSHVKSEPREGSSWYGPNGRGHGRHGQWVSIGPQILLERKKAIGNDEPMHAFRSSADRRFMHKKRYLVIKIMRCAFCRTPYLVQGALRRHLSRCHYILQAESPHFDCTPYTIVESQLQYLDDYAGPNQQLEYIYGQQQTAGKQLNTGTAVLVGTSSSSLAAQDLPRISLEAVGQQFDGPTTNSSRGDVHGQQLSHAAHLDEEEETTNEDIVCCSFCLDNVPLEDMCDHLETHDLPKLHKDEVWAFIREPSKDQQPPQSTCEEGKKEKRQAEGGRAGEKVNRIVLPQEVVRRSPRKKVATGEGGNLVGKKKSCYR